MQAFAAMAASMALPPWARICAPACEATGCYEATIPPVVKATIDQGLEHTVQGPPQAVAITPDGRLATVAAPTPYD